MKIDLHVHSLYSCDGEFSPGQLIKQAQAAAIDIISLSDHDSMAGVKEMMTAGKEAGIKVVPAIELTGQIDDNVTHILGYNINPDSPRFLNYLVEFEEKERATTAKLIHLFEQEVGLDVPFDEMFERCNQAIYALVAIVTELLNNPKYHDNEIVKPYLPGGARGELPIVNFWQDLCVKGKQFHIPMDIKTYAELIAEIHADGGIAIIAHPSDLYYENEEYLNQVIAAGVDGLEVFSTYHDDKLRQWYWQYAKKRQLLVSGGSDYHGYFKPQVQMGEFSCFDEQSVVFKDILASLLPDL